MKLKALTPSQEGLIIKTERLDAAFLSLLVEKLLFERTIQC